METTVNAWLKRYIFLSSFDFSEHGDHLHKSAFHNLEPPHLYLIGVRNKCIFIPESIEYNNCSISFDIKLYNRETQAIIPSTITLDKDNKITNAISEYPYDRIRVSTENTKDFLISINALLNKKDIINKDTLKLLDTEIIYIGKAYGEDGSKSAYDRLQNHSTYQKILSDYSRFPDKEVWVMLMHYEIKGLLSFDGAKAKKSPKESATDIQRGVRGIRNIRNFYDGTGYDQEQFVNMVEAGLINYFQPKYNSLLKREFPSQLHQSYSKYYIEDIHSLIIEFIPEYPCRFFTEITNTDFKHTKVYQFQSDESRKSFFSANNG